MKIKTTITKTAVMLGASLMLISFMQGATASTNEEGITTVFELTEANMDGITAGGKVKARARARGTRSASTSAVTIVKGRSSRAVAISTATGNRATTRARARASGDVVRTRGANRNGRYHSVSWRLSYGYNK